MTKVRDLTVKQLRRRMHIFETISFFVSILPVSIVILSKWDLYTASPGGVLKVAAGGVLLAIVLLMGVLGRLNVPGDIWAAVFVLVVSYLMQSVLDDIILLTAMYIVGRLCDKIVCRRYIKRIRAELSARRTAELTGQTVVDQIKQYLGGNTQ